MRVTQPVKAMRRMPVDVGENDELNAPPGAGGRISPGRRRPGRAASLRSSATRTRSQSWRSPKKGPRNMRRGVLAKGSRTGRNKAA